MTTIGIDTDVDTTNTESRDRKTARQNARDAIAILKDPRFDSATNKLRLQGFRGRDLDQALEASPIAHRIGPAVCSVLAAAAVITGSMTILLITLATALYGVVGRNHPVESAYNVWARRPWRTALPANRAAKRTGCAVGSLHLGGAAIAWAVGATVVGNVLLITLAGIAAFVAVSGLCVPSLMFITMHGVERSTKPNLASALRG